MRTDRILFVLTSADRMGNEPAPTGSWLEEIAAPYYTFLDARYAVTIATPKGGKAPIDPVSLEEENVTASTRRFDADSNAQAALAHTSKLSALNPDDFHALYFVGGHGTMEDFPKDASVRVLVEKFYAAGKPVASVCHGPACLVSATKPNGEPLIAGHRFTCFTDAEETAVGLAANVPFLLESRLAQLGGTVHRNAPFVPNVVVDGCLMTGQNTASSIPLAEAVIHQLRQQHPVRRAA